MNDRSMKQWKEANLSREDLSPDLYQHWRTINQSFR